MSTTQPAFTPGTIHIPLDFSFAISVLEDKADESGQYVETEHNLRRAVNILKYYSPPPEPPQSDTPESRVANLEEKFNALLDLLTVQRDQIGDLKEAIRRSSQHREPSGLRSCEFIDGKNPPTKQGFLIGAFEGQTCVVEADCRFYRVNFESVAMTDRPSAEVEG